MNTLREALPQYMALRRHLGFKLRETESVLLQFVSFMERHRARYITSPLALLWSQQPPGVSPARWARRLAWVRGFARYRSAIDPRTQVPATHLLPHQPKRARPYLYSPEEIARLLRAAQALPPAGSLRPWTYYCLIGLLSVSGLRSGEAHSLIGFLTRPEVEAVLAAPNRGTWCGRRDYALLLLAVQTGLRLSEITSLTADHLILSTGAHVRVIGKGRKERCTPLTRQTLAVLKAWLQEAAKNASPFLFPNARGGRLNADGVQYLLAKHCTSARRICPSLQHKRVTPHVLRHTTAMDLLQEGVDLTLIALWLGHESVHTTQVYLEATLALKEKALAKATPIISKHRRYQPTDQLLSFLDRL